MLGFIPTASGSGVFVLEDKLAGVGTQELLRVVIAENRGHGNIFDLQEVIYVDSGGEEAMRILGGAYGSSFITESAYWKDLRKRLKLHRVTIAEVENNCCQVRECSRTTRSRHAADVNKHNSLTGAAEKRNPTRFGE
jgi:hypothetical protein